MKNKVAIKRVNCFPEYNDNPRHGWKKYYYAYLYVESGVDDKDLRDEGEKGDGY